MPHTDPEITRAALSRDALLVLDNAQGVAVAVDAGVIWLTLHNDTRDVFVRAGERFRIDRPGRTVIMAHEPATLRLIQPVRLRVLRAIGTAIARGMRRMLDAPARRAAPSTEFAMPTAGAVAVMNQAMRRSVLSRSTN